MFCIKCGYQNDNNSQFCIKCGQPLMKKAFTPPVRKKTLAVAIAATAVVVAVCLLILLIPADPIAGRWYASSGAELILLKNGKGMSVTGEPGEAKRVHFMYALGYREPGYIEGEIYERDSGTSTWFYLYDGLLDVDGEYYYRQKPSV